MIVGSLVASSLCVCVCAGGGGLAREGSTLRAGAGVSVSAADVERMNARIARLERELAEMAAMIKAK